MAFRLRFTSEASAVLEALAGDTNYAKKLKKIRKTLGYIEANPTHPGLQSHEYESLRGPAGEPIWESYVENNTPGAWRIWWWYGPARGEISILTIGPHPD